MKAATFLSSALHHRRLVLSCVAILALAGIASWISMPRQEDPRLPDRFGVLVTVFPGSDTEKVERLVAIPLEEELAQVRGLRRVRTTIRGEAVVSRIEMKQTVTDVEPIWDDIEDAIEKARAKFPETVLKPQLDKRVIGDQEAIILSITGSDDLLLLREAARDLRTELLRVEDVAEVNLIADPGEEIHIDYNESTARATGISVADLSARLRSRNQSIPAGRLHVGPQSLILQAGSEFSSLEELRQTPIVLPSGSSVPLVELADVERRPASPANTLMRVAGQSAVGLSIVSDRDIHLVNLGERVSQRLRDLSSEYAPLQIDILSFQPGYVEARLAGLGKSLLGGIGIVALVLVLAMGLRIGLLVSLVVPIVASISIALYAFGGGVLQQMSVAALILALGLLVDNAIVVVESAQHYLDSGLARRDAAIKAARDLAFPLATATGTTIAAFVPMLLAKGAVGDFTRAIPIVTITTLIVSYAFAVFVTPILAAAGLRKTSSKKRRFARATEWVSGAGVGRPKTILALAGVAVLAAGLGASQLRNSFFPRADRNQFVVDVLLPAGTHLQDTSDTARVLEQHLVELDTVRAVSTFVGRGTPRFYYNLPDLPQSPHLAQLMIETDSQGDVPALIEEVRRFAHQQMPEAEVVPRFLEQGPPLNAPIEVVLHGDDLEASWLAAEAVMAALRKMPGTRNVRHDLGGGAPNLAFDVHDAAADRAQLSRADVASRLMRQTRGLPIGTLRNGTEPTNIEISATEGQNIAPQHLSSMLVGTRTGALVPLGHVAGQSLEFRPAVVHRQRQERYITVAAQLADGFEYGPIIQQLGPKLDALMPPNVRWSWGGSAEGSGDANSAMAKAAPLGLLLLLLCILIEFNSFRRLGIILSTIPLAAAGVVPGLLLGNQPFGFMSFLGVFALIGVVVNNAIVLLSVIDARRAEGQTVQEALRSGVQLRLRPILLTSLTTVAGLLPLAFSSSPLWPPMASAMIAGLIASTFLALFVVPALYALLFAREDRERSALGRLAGASQ